MARICLKQDGFAGLLFKPVFDLPDDTIQHFHAFFHKIRAFSQRIIRIVREIRLAEQLFRPGAPGDAFAFLPTIGRQLTPTPKAAIDVDGFDVDGVVLVGGMVVDHRRDASAPIRILRLLLLFAALPADAGRLPQDRSLRDLHPDRCRRGPNMRLQCGRQMSAAGRCQ